jgi:hypothetical protein
MFALSHHMEKCIENFLCFFRLLSLQKHVKAHQINKNEKKLELLMINPNLEFFNFACCITHFKHWPPIDITLI